MDGLDTLGLGATLRRSSAHVWTLRVLAFVAPFVVLGATMAASGAAQPVAAALTFALALACAASRDAHLGLVTVLALAVNWLRSVDDTTTPWVLPAAAGLVLLHASLAALTVAPPAARWRAGRARVWATRTVVVWAACVPVWLLSTVLVDRRWTGRADVLTAALVLVTAGAAWLRRLAVRR